MKANEWRTQSDSSLRDKLAELRDSLRAMRFSIANRQHKTVRDLRSVRKDAARILTELSARAKKGEKKA